MQKHRAYLAASIDEIKDEPPYEIKGSGTPITGKIPETIAIFTIAWVESHAIIPPVAIPNKTGLLFGQ